MASYIPQRSLPVDQCTQMSSVVSGLSTKADKIRALAAAGYSRGDTAAFLGIRYQHVRNVLGPLHASAASLAPSTPRSRPAEPPAPSGVAPVETEGRIRLPAEVVAALEIDPGDEALWRFEHGDLVIMGRRSSLQWAHELAARYSRGRTESWTDELIRERQEEAMVEESLERGR